MNEKCFALNSRLASPDATEQRCRGWKGVKPMNAKEYLGQAYRIDQRVCCKLEQVMSLRELVTKAKSTISDTLPNNKNMECTIAKMIDLETKINDDVDNLVDLKRGIVSVIKQMKNLEYQTLLEQRYLHFKTWEQIAVEMSYDLRYLHKLHSRALNEFLKVDTKRH